MGNRVRYILMLVFPIPSKSLKNDIVVAQAYITSFEKHLESSLDRTPNFCQNLVIFRSKNMYLKESLTRSSTVI